MLLDREEYIEQAYLFRALNERMKQGIATQDLLKLIKEEILATTKLPMALDFLSGELRHHGIFGPGMARLAHYFAPFQTFIVDEAENDRGKFDLSIALKILEREAQYRAEGATPQGLFIFQFECVARNRLRYDRGLQAIADDPMYEAAWREWILTVRRQLGVVEFTDMIYVRSEQYLRDLERRNPDLLPLDKPVLFGQKEGRIALANRHKDPLLLFAALHRQLGYPEVPKLEPIDQTPFILPTLVRRMDRLELRMKLLEEEQKGGLDITKFYGREVQLPESPDDGSQ